MDNEVKTKGRKPSKILNDDDLEKQKKRHQYYLNSKAKNPDYYKKSNSILGKLFEHYYRGCYGDSNIPEVYF